jgi:hypothetical protein
MNVTLHSFSLISTVASLGGVAYKTEELMNASSCLWLLSVEATLIFDDFMRYF